MMYRHGQVVTGNQVSQGTLPPRARPQGAQDVTSPRTGPQQVTKSRRGPYRPTPLLKELKMLHRHGQARCR